MESYLAAQLDTHVHQCLRKYFDNAMGTFLFDADGPPSTDPNDNMNCGE